MVNVECYFIDELNEKEELIFNVEVWGNEFEYGLFCDLRD